MLARRNEELTPRVEVPEPGWCSRPARGPSRYFGGDTALAALAAGHVGTALAALNRGKPFNPLYMHPDAVSDLGLESGCSVLVTSNHDSVAAVLGRNAPPDHR